VGKFSLDIFTGVSLMTTSNREAIRAQRTKKKRQKRLTTILGVGGFIILVFLVLISPTIYNSLKPAGSFVHITPIARLLENGKSIGDPNAKVKIQVYEDFQCPACKQYTENIEPQLLQSSYITNGQVYYEFMQWPFIDTGTITKESHQAANASMCAMAQGRFWDYHDILFANQGVENGGNFTDKRLQAFAESLGLDMTAFNKCFKANTYSSEIEADYQEGVAAGVNSTPTVLLNGKEVTPGVIPTYDQIKSAIDAALSGGG
jgi:protein-disulfide isomerase